MERNPLRAGLVEEAERWGWSSAAARLEVVGTPIITLVLACWRERFTAEEWRVLLPSDSMCEAEDRLSANTYTGRPRKNVEESGAQGMLFAEGAR